MYSLSCVQLQLHQPLMCKEIMLNSRKMFN
uniref:Uncharacterized protein n=1 Tax=Anguilla anguilla TaxID=7936 RepID=A0A0E9T870_ANGAN